MRTIQTIAYQYAELSPDAQAKARDWYRRISDGDTFFAETVTEEFLAALRALGFNTTSKQIGWSGFYSQGDGAGFAGNWSAEGCNPGALLADRPVSYMDATGTAQTCPTNVRLHEACAPFVALASKYPYACGETSHGRGYYQRADFDANDGDGEPDDTLTEEFREACAGLADYLYRTLEAEYEYQNSDEQVADMLVANEYEFTESGECI